MQLTVKGKHLDVGDALREHVHDNLSHTTEKYFRDPIEATVIFTKEKNHRYKANVSIHVGRGVVLEAQHEADDPYPAFDIASQRVATRLSRYKDRLRDHRRGDESVEMQTASYTTFESNEAEAEASEGPAVVAEMETVVPTLAVADAVMRLELGDLPALLFKNPAHGAYNMVYRRKDGNIGWIDPEGGKAEAKGKTRAKGG
jgi:ribosomal subunit interface protein